MENFFKDVGKMLKKAGEEVIYAALLLYFTLDNPKTPGWAKTIIIGSIAYLILPIDLIPDYIPVAGFTDDLGSLVLALAQVAMYIDEDVKTKARSKMADWFGAGFDHTSVEQKLFR